MTKLLYKIIQLLELDRKIIAISLNKLRANIFDLQQKYSQLAEDYISLRNQLDTLTTIVYRSDKLNLSTESTRRFYQYYNTNQKLKQIIGNIRKLSDFEQFLRIPTENKLKVVAVLESVVIINISKYRCDTLIIEKRKLQTLRLPDLDSKDIRARTVVLKRSEQQLLK